MTLSIGFRAPNQRELISSCAEQLISGTREELRFSDPERQPAEHPSRIVEADLKQLRELVRSGLALGDDELDRFLGCTLTRPKPQLEVEGEPLEPRSIERRLVRGERLVRRLGGRLLLLPRGGELWLFAEGQEYQLELSHLDWLEPLADGTLVVDAACAKRYPGALPWLAILLGRGSIQWQR